MIKYILGLVLLFPISSSAGYVWTNPRVVDGDTIEFQVDWLPKELGNKIKVRVYGIDTPEKSPRASCIDEANRGLKAAWFTKTLIESAKNIEVEIKGWDKYGGRILGDVNVDGKSLRKLLLQNNLAKEYYGEAKQSWCN